MSVSRGVTTSFGPTVCDTRLAFETRPCLGSCPYALAEADGLPYDKKGAHLYSSCIVNACPRHCSRDIGGDVFPHPWRYHLAGLWDAYRAVALLEACYAA